MRIELDAREGAVALSMTLAACTAGAAMSQVADGSRAVAAAAVAGAIVLVVGSSAFAAWRARRAVDVEVDDGGVRIKPRRGEHGEYVPFARIERAQVRASVGRAVLHLQAGAALRALPLAEGHPPDLAASIERGVEAARRARPTPAPPTLARGGQPLDVWLGRVRALAASGSWREQAVDPSELARVLEDRAADPELRAAAAHALVAARGEHAARAMGALGPSSPPLVIVAAALASPHGTWIAGFPGVLAYLPADDRALAEKLASERPRLRVGGASEAADADAEGGADAEVEVERRAARR